ncbi:19739_t:CDS:1, partial [Racocetra fulgida]
TCCVWQEDSQHNFIIYIPPNVNYEAYYCFNYATFDGINDHGSNLRNGILTYQTLDNTTAYWVDLDVRSRVSVNADGDN